MILFLLGALVIGSLVFEVAFGAPFVPILKNQIHPIIKALELKPGQTLIDLGCGDGRILKAAAKEGIRGIGYEINPWLVIVAKINCYKYRGLVKIKLANYWQIKLPAADAIFTFLITGYMPKLDKMLQKQISCPTKVLSYVYPIPNRKAKLKGPNFYLYKYS